MTTSKYPIVSIPVNRSELCEKCKKRFVCFSGENLELIPRSFEIKNNVTGGVIEAEFDITDINCGSYSDPELLKFEGFNLYIYSCNTYLVGNKQTLLVTALIM